MRCHGVPLVTISRGRLVCENGVFMCAEGSGKFYGMRTFPDFLYKKMVQREKVLYILMQCNYEREKVYFLAPVRGEITFQLVAAQMALDELGDTYPL